MKRAASYGLRAASNQGWLEARGSWLEAHSLMGYANEM
jgi:hypothetical protein